MDGSCSSGNLVDREVMCSRCVGDSPMGMVQHNLRRCLGGGIFSNFYQSCASRIEMESETWIVENMNKNCLQQVRWEPIKWHNIDDFEILNIRVQTRKMMRPVFLVWIALRTSLAAISGPLAATDDAAQIWQTSSNVGKTRPVAWARFANRR